MSLLSADPYIPPGIQSPDAVSADPLIPSGIQIGDPCGDACANLAGDPVSYDQCLQICRDRATGTGPQIPALQPLPWWADPNIVPTLPTSSGDFLRNFGLGLGDALRGANQTLVLLIGVGVVALLLSRKLGV